MFTFLRAPYPGFTNPLRAVTISFFAGFFVFAFLYVFTPFGLAQIESGSLLRNTLLFGAVTTVAAVWVTTIMPKLLPRVFNETKWVVWKEIFAYSMLVLLVTCLNLLLTAYLYGNGFSFAFLLRMLVYTSVIGLVPISISVLVKQQLLLRKYRSGAARIETETLTQEAKMPAKPEPALMKSLQFKGDNQGEVLDITLHDWLMVMASDNYCQIYYLKDGRLQDRLFRTSLKKLVNQIVGVEAAWRCHKSYLVNLQQVVHISGNAQGYRLHLANTELTVPVSRSLNTQVQEKLAKFHHSQA